MGGELSFVDFARHGGGDNGGGVLIPNVVLHDEYRPNPTLLTPHDGGQIRIIQFSAFDNQNLVPLVENAPLLKYM